MELEAGKKYLRLHGDKNRKKIMIMVFKVDRIEDHRIYGTELLTNKEYLTTKWSPNITSKDDNAIEKAIKIGGQAGQRFLPIWLQSSVKSVKEQLEAGKVPSDIAADVALDFVLGQLGHPRYKGPRHTQYKLGGLVRNPYETLF